MKKIISCFIISLLLFPNLSLAEGDVKCNPKGYTIFTINGVLTNQRGAEANKDALDNKIREILNIPKPQLLTFLNFATNQKEPLTIIYLHNPIHLAGLGDFLKSLEQKSWESLSKYFKDSTFEDYDTVSQGMTFLFRPSMTLSFRYDMTDKILDKIDNSVIIKLANVT